MVRKSALAAFLIASLIPSGISALGLGSIVLKSALNQPLSAEIELLSVQAEDLEDIRISLASPEAFERAGVERPYFLSKLRFKAAARANGIPYVQVTSQEAVREPFVDFLIEVNWRSGRLVREYTVLLDPPVTSSETPPAVQAPQVSTPVPAMTPQTRGAAQTRQAPDFSSRPADSSAPTEYGPVQRLNTLWVIAEELRPDASFSVEQTMLALLRHNPEAFIDANVNNLKEGSVLRLPEPDAIAAVDKTPARREFLRQTAEWRERRLQMAASAGPRPVTPQAADEEAAVAGDTQRPHLKLASLDPAKPAQTQAGAGLADSTATVHAVNQLREDLALVSEEADAARQENSGLGERVAFLEDQLASLRRLITLKNENMAALQARLRDGAQVGDSEAPAVEPPAITAEAAATGQAQPEAKPKSVSQAAAASDRHGLAGLLDNPVTLGILIAVVLIVLTLLGLIIRRRTQTPEVFDESMLAAALSEAELEESTPLAPESVAPGTQKDASFLEGSDRHDTASGEEAADEVDPLAEADVYMAYGRYNHAEDMIKQAISSAPQRQDLKVKLLEIYSALEDRDRFAAYAEEIYESLEAGDSSAWERVVPLGMKLCPDHALFSGDAAVVETPANFMPSDAPVAESSDQDEMTLAWEVPLNLEKELGLESAQVGENEVQAGAQADRAKGEPNSDETALEFDIGLSDKTSAEEEVPLGNAQTSPEAAPSEAIDKKDDLEMDLGLDWDATVEEFEAGSDAVVPEKERGETDASDLSSASMAEELDLDSLAMQDSELELSLEGLSQDTGTEPQETSAADALDELLRQESPQAPVTDETLVEAELEPAAELTDQGVVGAQGELLPEPEEEVTMKLELARAYVDLGDSEGARSILDEILAQGTETQKEEARALLDQVA